MIHHHFDHVDSTDTTLHHTPHHQWEEGPNGSLHDPIEVPYAPHPTEVSSNVEFGRSGHYWEAGSSHVMYEYIDGVPTGNYANPG